jgi:hypothetical protein
MSTFSDEKLNWLDQVKLDAEAITKQRLEAELPVAEAQVKARKASKPTEPSQPLPGQSDGSPDQGAIEEADKKGKK